MAACGIENDSLARAGKVHEIIEYFNNDSKPDTLSSSSSTPAPAPLSAGDVCPYFQQGFCRNGNYCQFRHTAPTSLCIYFQQGYCRDGNLCRYSHGTPGVGGGGGGGSGAGGGVRVSVRDGDKVKEKIKALQGFLKNADEEVNPHFSAFSN
jgi:hypothetical protein